jgi:hypothetical protein
MAEPIVTAAAITAGASILGALIEGFSGDDLADLQREVLEEQLGQARRLSRVSKGQFTSGERKAIEEGNRPTLERISGTLAQRGLSRSGAGGQIIAEAQQRPFLAAQQAATVGAPGALASAQGGIGAALAQQNAEREQIFGAIGGFIQNYALSKQLTAQNPGDPDVALMNEAMSEFFNQGTRAEATFS